MVVCSIAELVEDAISNGELTKDDIQILREFIDNKIDIEFITELLSIPENLDDVNIHEDFQLLLEECITKLYVSNNELSNISAKSLINLFDPDNILTHHEREALKRLKQIKHGIVFQNFLDDNCI